MNIFDVILLDFILILFPILVYMVYLSTNKNINKSTKNLMFSLTLISSYFLIIKFNNNYEISFLIISIIVLLSSMKKQYITTFILLLLLILSFYSQINMLFFIPYLIILINFKKKLSDFLFIDIFLILELIIYILIYHKININILFIFLCSYLVMYIIYILFIKCEEIIKYHMDYKELQQEKQIRLSLFKITHEIKNPIAVCRGYLDMLDINNEKQVRKYIPIIQSEIERLLVLLEDFMLVNSENINCDIMDINMLLEEVVGKLKPLLEEKNIKLNLDLIDDEIYINGDYKRLSQVFINLVKNSIEAIQDKGLISIKNIISNNILKIIIEDNGIGISKDVLKRMKEPFYTTKVRGTGLGVSLSNEIIKAHKGSLNYESIVGLGTKTIILIPIDEEVSIK